MMDKATQLRVAQALVKEYGWMGVNLSAAMKAVEAGDWDDHPLAQHPKVRRKVPESDLEWEL